MTETAEEYTEESTSLEEQLNLGIKERKPQIRAHFSGIKLLLSQLANTFQQPIALSHANKCISLKYTILHHLLVFLA